MKKILFASTALVLTAGVAAAEVTVGGDGRMGVVYTEGAGLLVDPGADGLFDTNDDTVITPAGEEFAFSSRIRISFTATGETDTGLAFGGSIRADNAGAGANGLAGSVFVSGAFGKLSMGDVDSGGKAAVGQVDGIGYTGLGDLNEIIYVSTPVDEAALYEGTFGGFSVYASLDQINDDNTAASIGVGYSFGDFTVAAGYETAEDFDQTLIGAGGAAAVVDLDSVDHFILGGSATFGAIVAKAVVGFVDAEGPLAGSVDDFDGTQYAISGTYTTGPIAVTAFYRDQDFDLGPNSIDTDASYGIGASYDLGGGAALKGGIAHNGGRLQNVSGDNDVVADFGITMSF